jgi:hypothetical protein
LLFLQTTKLPKDEYLQLHLVRPSIMLSLIGLLAEGGIRRLPRHHDYILISASALFMVVITMSIVDLLTMSCILSIFSGIAFGVLARGRGTQPSAFHLRIEPRAARPYGHKAGDAVLKRVAGIIRSKAGSNDIVARYGGEEFALIFTEKSPQEAYDTVEDIRKEVASTLHEAIMWQAVTISVGLRSYSQGMGKDALFVGADKAVYEAKRSGKNRTVIAKPGSVSVVRA